MAQLALGDEDRAMSALGRAIREGRLRYCRSLHEIDPVYDSLRSRPEFQALLDEIRADMAEQLEKFRAWEASADRPLVLDFAD